jgi:hypothetical protein
MRLDAFALSPIMGVDKCLDICNREQLLIRLGHGIVSKLMVGVKTSWSDSFAMDALK